MAVITPQSSQIHRLNGTAAELFAACAGEGASEEELLQTTLARYEVTPEEATQAIQAFLQDAVARGILEVVAPSP